MDREKERKIYHDEQEGIEEVAGQNLLDELEHLSELMFTRTKDPGQIVSEIMNNTTTTTQKS